MGDRPETSPEGPTEARGRGVVANTLFGLVAQATTAAFTTVLTLYLVRTLGPNDYGLFALALSVGAVSLMVSDFGLASSGGRYVAERLGDLQNLRRVTEAVLRLKLIGAFLVAGLLFALAPLIAAVYGEHGLAWPLRLTAVSLFFESMLLLYTSAFGSLRRVSLNAVTIFLESAVETTATIGLVLAGAGVTGAVAGRATGYAAGTIVAVVLLARIVGRSRLGLRAGDPELSRTIAAYARPLLVINGAYTLYSYVDALLIGVLLTARDVGEFTAPLRLVTLIGYIGQSVATAVAPRLAGANPDVPGFFTALRWLLVLQGLLIVPILAWAEPIVDLLLGPDYRVAGQVLRALAPYAFLYGIGPLITMTVTYVGGARRRVPIVLFALAINLVIDLALLPVMGVEGAAVGTGVAFAIYVPAHLRVFTSAFSTDLRPLGVTLVRTLAAAGLATGVLLLIGNANLKPWQWAAGVVAAPVAYVGGLLVLGEFSREELRALRARLRRER